MRMLGRLLLAAFALVMAIPAGALTLGAGVLLDPGLRDAFGRLGLVGLFAGLSDLAQGLPPEMAAMAILVLIQALSLLLILPPTLAALIGETLGLRSPVWYGGATGALTALLPWLPALRSRPGGGGAPLRDPPRDRGRLRSRLLADRRPRGRDANAAVTSAAFLGWTDAGHPV